MIIHQKITIVRVNKPIRHNLNEELLWLGESLGLFSLRDKDKSQFRIFIELLKSSKMNKPISSDELAYKLKLTRGTVIHHINKLKNMGLVKSVQNKYFLRVNSLTQLITEIKKDLIRTCDDLIEISKDLDKQLGTQGYSDKGTFNY